MSADERRETVLRAAVHAFAVGGLDGTSTETIARDAGISQPYLFRLYPTKKALFLASTQRCFDRVAAAFTAAAEGLAGDAALDAMAVAYTELLGDRDLLMHQMQAYAACDDPDVREVTRNGFGALWGLVERASGAGDEVIRGFFAHGMLINVITAMDLRSQHTTWAAACMPPGVSPPGAG